MENKARLKELVERGKQLQSQRILDRNIVKLVIKRRDLSHIYDEEGSNIPSRDAIADVVEESEVIVIADLLYELIMRLGAHDIPTESNRGSWTWGDYKYSKWD